MRAAIEAHTALYGDMSHENESVSAGEETSPFPSIVPFSPISSLSTSPIPAFSTPASTEGRRRIRTDWVEEEERCPPASTERRKRVRTDWVEEEERCPPASTERRKRVRTDWVEEEERWLTCWLRRQPQHSCYDWVKCLNDLRLDPAAHAVFSVSIL